MYKNEEDVARIWSDNRGEGENQGTNMVVLELSVGDTVSVRLILGGCTMDGAEMYNSFSGFRIGSLSQLSNVNI